MREEISYSQIRRDTVGGRALNGEGTRRQGRIKLARIPTRERIDRRASLKLKTLSYSLAARNIISIPIWRDRGEQRDFA